MTGSSSKRKTGDSPAVGGSARAGLSRGRRLLFGLIAITISLIVTLLIAEFAVRPFVPAEIVGPSCVHHHPTLNKWLKPDFTCRITANGITYRLTTNSLAFRGPEPAKPPRGAIVLLGDSYTMGDTVNDGEEYAQVLAGFLADEYGIDAPPVVNMGMAGNGNGRWVKLLRDRAPEFEPRVVVMQFCYNDFRDNREEGLFKIGAEGELIERSIPPQSRLRGMQEWLEDIGPLQYSRLMALVKQGIKTLSPKGVAAAGIDPEMAAEHEARDRVRSDLFTDLDPGDELTFKLLDRSLEICEESGWPVVAMIVGGGGERQARLEEVFASRGTPVIRIPSKDERPDICHVEDDHWNPEGHRMVAGIILDEVQRRGLLGVPSE